MPRLNSGDAAAATPAAGRTVESGVGSRPISVNAYPKPSTRRRTIRVWSPAYATNGAGRSAGREGGSTNGPLPRRQSRTCPGRGRRKGGRGERRAAKQVFVGGGREGGTRVHPVLAATVLPPATRSRRSAGTAQQTRQHRTHHGVAEMPCQTAKTNHVQSRSATPGTTNDMFIATAPARRTRQRCSPSAQTPR